MEEFAFTETMPAPTPESRERRAPKRTAKSAKGKGRQAARTAKGHVKSAKAKGRQAPKRRARKRR